MEDTGIGGVLSFYIFFLYSYIITFLKLSLKRKIIDESLYKFGVGKSFLSLTSRVTMALIFSI